MKVIYNKIIPFKRFYAINLFGTLFIRDIYKDRPVIQSTLNHESIHTEQAIDLVLGCEKLKILGYVLFYILYFIEWVIKLIFSIFSKVKVYRSISFEQEAYNNQNNYNYLNDRKRFVLIKYIFKLVGK